MLIVLGIAAYTILAFVTGYAMLKREIKWSVNRETGELQHDWSYDAWPMAIFGTMFWPMFWMIGGCYALGNSENLRKKIAGKPPREALEAQLEVLLKEDNNGTA